MKKLIMLFAFCGLATSLMAQTEESYPTMKHGFISNGFWDNWFIDAGVTHLSFYSGQEHGAGVNKNPFWPGRRSWGGELSVGKWATPAFGLRVKGQAAWGTQVNGNSMSSSVNPTFKQFSVSIQPMVNLTNLFGGYKQRWWEISLYGGAGFMRDCTYDQYSPVVDLGVFNSWNITKRFHINLDIYGRLCDTGVDGLISANTVTPHIKNRDYNFGVSAGIGVNLGKVGWQKAPDMDAILANHRRQINELQDRIAALEAENADLKRKLAEKPKEVVKTVTEFTTTSASVFFNINKSEIASKKDLVNVKELADYAIANNKTMVVTGYCDSATGSVEFNQTLSEKRAETVADELVNMGVSRDKIEVSGQGGVNDLEPFSYNRRAIVTLK